MYPICILYIYMYTHAQCILYIGTSSIIFTYLNVHDSIHKTPFMAHSAFWAGTMGAARLDYLWQPFAPSSTYDYLCLQKNTPQGIKLAIPRAHGEGITSECFSHHGSLLAKTMVMNHRLRGCAAHLCVCQHKSQRICWPETSKLLTFWEWNMVMKSRNLFG